jgi:hypothetical protein
MRLFTPLILTGLVGLSACGTPQEQCIASVTRDMRVVDGLIAETEANLSRGYALEKTVKYRPEWAICGYSEPTEENPEPSPELCLDDVPYESTRPAAIDLNAERAKLASLREKRAQQGAEAAAAIAACQAAYPE